MPVIGPFVDTSVPDAKKFNSWSGAPGTNPVSTSPNDYLLGAPFRTVRTTDTVGRTSIDVWTVSCVSGGFISNTVDVYIDGAYSTTLNYGATQGLKQKQSFALDGGAHTVDLVEQAVITNVLDGNTQTPIAWATKPVFPNAVLFNGDSIFRDGVASAARLSYFYKTALALGPTWGCTNWGVSGKNMIGNGNDYIADLARCFGTAKNLVCNNLGINDYINGNAVATYTAAYTTWLTGILANAPAVPGLKVLIISLTNFIPTPISGTPGGPNLAGSTYLDFYNAQLALAAAFPAAAFLDWRVPGIYTPPPTTLYTPDQVHPNDAGHALNATSLTAKILTL